MRYHAVYIDLIVSDSTPSQGFGRVTVEEGINAENEGYINASPTPWSKSSLSVQASTEYDSQTKTHPENAE
jgi:hypothetical protein